jgi:hypothetical protein
MKTRLATWLLLLALSGSLEVRALQAAARNYGSEMAVNAEVQADFFARYPDLQDEREAVALAARALAAEGRETSDVAVAAEALATRTRALLARRSPQEWQRKAVSLFPELGVAGSEFNTLFLRHYQELQQTSPQFTQEPSWPVLLARRCADELRPKQGNSAVAQGATKVAPDARGNPNPTASTLRMGFWPSLLNLTLLLAIIVQPARWLLRCSRAFAGSEAPLTLWQRALRPAAWTYLALALIALVRTFLANADQRFFDRFGITLLVSLLAGLVVALPAYGIALAGMWWLRRRVPAGTKVSAGEMRESPASGRAGGGPG